MLKLLHNKHTDVINITVMIKINYNVLHNRRRGTNKKWI